MYIVKRSQHNPILEPSSDRPWEGAGTFNGCPVKKDGKTHLLYRALGKPDPLLAPGVYLSSIGHAVSDDGNVFKERTQFIAPSEAWDKYGCEDPRTTFFEGRYYTFYTALAEVPFGPSSIRIGCAISDDLETIAEKKLVTRFNAKAFALFPERINGKITAILTAHSDEPPQKLAIAQADRMEEFWSEEYWKAWHENIESNTVQFQRTSNDFVEVGAVPIKTDDGWLLIYSYIQDYFAGAQRVFGIEAALVAHNDPRVFIGRTHSPLLVPETPYEVYGLVGRVTFPSGALVVGERLDIYYGAADTFCAKASVYLPDLLDALVPDRRARFAQKSPHNPILQPNPNSAWQARAVLNPGAIELKGTIYVLYRAMSQDNTSVIGLAESIDGTTISTLHPEPIYVPRADFEKKRGSPTGNSGCEDPRIMKVEERLYMLYTAYDGVEAPRVAITSIAETDFLAHKWNQWTMPVRISPAHVSDKDACILPERIDGKYVVVHRIDPNICQDMFDDLNFSDSEINRCFEILMPREGTWEQKKVGIAGPIIKTEKGLLMIYHAVSKHGVYQLGAALLDSKDPTHVLGRLNEPFLSPQHHFEKEGEIPNVVFSCGQAVRADVMYVYYGGADKVVCVATLSLSKLLRVLTPECLEEI